MTEIVSLPASMRERAGKGAARATRRAGKLPAVVYGNKEAPTLIAIEPTALKQQLKRAGFFTRLIDLDIDGKPQRVLPRDVQFHPVSDAPVHVDFLRVSADSIVTVEVPVKFVNEGASPGLKKGGVLNIVRHEVELLCPVNSIPQALVIDLTGRDIGDSIHISHIPLPEGARPTITDRDFTVATVAPPTVQTEEERPAAAATPAAGAAAAPAEAAKPAKK